MILTTRHPWQVQFAETPRPRALTGGVDVVQTGLRVGMSALEDLREVGAPVGPALCCLGHGLLHIPVASGTVDRWRAAHSRCLTGSWNCAGASGERACAPCPGRFWLLPHESQYATAAPTELHARLSSARALMRSAAA